MKKGTRLIKKMVALLMVLLLSIESFAAVVSDNDGSAFITKAEFDSLKNNFQSQIDQYNTSIDEKIDGAIASYLAGIRVDKKEEIRINNAGEEVYCLYNRTNSETKDLEYKWSMPIVSCDGIDFTYGNGYGVYAHHYQWKPANINAVGERNIIEDVYENTTNGNARWLGHLINCYEEMACWYSHGKNTNTYGAHMNNGYFLEMYYPSKTSHDTKVNFNNASVDFVYPNMSYGHSSGGSPSIDGYLWSQNYLVGPMYIQNWNLRSNNEYIAKNLIVCSPEEYNAFSLTDSANNYFQYDNIEATGSKNDTRGPNLFFERTKNLTNWYEYISFFKDLWPTVRCNRAYSQQNLGVYGKGGDVACVRDARVPCTGLRDDWAPPTGHTYFTAKGRWLYPVAGFPFKYINNWNKLYMTQTDWAIAELLSIPSDNLIIKTDLNGEQHLGLQAGWPLVKLKKERKYEVELKFKESSDHLVFFNYGPFKNDSPDKDINTSIIINGSYERDSRFSNAIKVPANRTTKVSFEATEDNVLFLKWCDVPGSDGEIKGGGTLILPDKITEQDNS